MSGSQLTVNLMLKAVLFGLLTEGCLMFLIFTPALGMCGFVYNSSTLDQLKRSLGEPFGLKLVILLITLTVWCAAIWFGIVKLAGLLRNTR